MGCAHANSQLPQPQTEPVRRNYSPHIGLLTVKIVELNFKANNPVSTESSYKQLKFQMSNQSFVSFLHHNFGHKSNVTVQPSAFDFTINKFQKRRQMNVQLLSNQELRCSKRLAVSHFDPSSIVLKHESEKMSRINSQDQPHQTVNIKLVDLSNDQVCSLFLLVKFIPESYQIVTIKVNSVTLRNYSLRKRRIYVRVQVGEETFESTSALQNRVQIPTWSDAFHTFIIPASLKEGVISVYQQNKQRPNNLLGQLSLNLNTILIDQKLQSYCEQLKFGSEITGTIKLQTLKTLSQDQIQKNKIDEPLKIALQKQRIEGREEFKIKINSMESLQKAMQNEPTTNFEQSLSRGFSSGRMGKDGNCTRMGKDGKSTIKSSNIYRRNQMILPPIHSAPLSGRQSVYRSWLEENIEEEKAINKHKQKSKTFRGKMAQEPRQQFSFEKEAQKQQKQLNIIRTQSHLVQRIHSKPVHSEQSQYQDQTELPPLNNFFIKLTQDIQTIHVQKANFQNHLIQTPSTRKRKPTTFSRNQNHQKMHQPIIQPNKKLITIEKDLQSRPLTPCTTQKDSKPFITLESGFVQFDLSLKDQSSQGQNQNTHNKFVLELYDSNQGNPPQKQNIHRKQGIKIHAIKQLGRLSDEQFWDFKQFKAADLPLWQQQQKITNPQIQPQM